MLHGSSGVKYVRVATDTFRLAEVRLIDTVDLGQLDIFLLQSGGGLLIMGRESLAVTTPTQVFRIHMPNYSLKYAYQGAKNSTSMRASGLTTSSKVLAVRSKTSEPPSPKTEVSSESADRRCEKRMSRWQV